MVRQIVPDIDFFMSVPLLAVAETFTLDFSIVVGFLVLVQKKIRVHIKIMLDRRLLINGCDAIFTSRLKLRYTNCFEAFSLPIRHFELVSNEDRKNRIVRVVLLRAPRAARAI